MDSLVALWDQYGLFAVLVLVGLSNAGKIGAWTERVVGRVLPHWREERQEKREMARQQVAVEQTHYVETVLMLKKMLLEYRTELDDSKWSGGN
jgi:hypothetical protein